MGDWYTKDEQVLVSWVHLKGDFYDDRSTSEEGGYLPLPHHFLRCEEENIRDQHCDWLCLPEEYWHYVNDGAVSSIKGTDNLELVTCPDCKETWDYIEMTIQRDTVPEKE